MRMKSVYTSLFLLLTTASFAQGLNYSPSRQLLRMDLGMTIFGDIGKPGGYAAATYEYAFLEHVAADFYLNTALHHPSSYIGKHASRWGTGINVIGRLYGLQSPYDVKLYAGARYGSSFHTELVNDGSQIVATDGDQRAGFSPVLGAGYEQRLGDWLLMVDFRVDFEQNLETYTSLALGIGYRF